MIFSSNQYKSGSGSAKAKGKLFSLRVIGDAEAPNTIAQGIFSGHLAAREFDEAPKEGVPFDIEHISF